MHPELQGIFDIWVPHLIFFDPITLKRAEAGVRLYGQKNFPAKVTASSWGSFYSWVPYYPVDAYDGDHFSRWVPKTEPTPENPQWLRFDFEEPAKIDGIRIEPYSWYSEPVSRREYKVEVVWCANVPWRLGIPASLLCGSVCVLSAGTERRGTGK